jgi:hypothetical protein
MILEYPLYRARKPCQIGGEPSRIPHVKLDRKVRKRLRRLVVRGRLEVDLFSPTHTITLVAAQMKQVP